jgi:hypothetical protein
VDGYVDLFTEDGWKWDWSIVHSASALEVLFKTAPCGSQVTILLESDDATEALLEGERMEREHVDLVTNVSLPQWKVFLSAWRNKGIQRAFGKLDEAQDAEFIHWSCNHVGVLRTRQLGTDE